MIQDSAGRNHGPGVVGFPTHFLGRYREFDEDRDRLAVPPGSELSIKKGVNVARAYNDMVRFTLNNEKFEWLFILGDDHTFRPDILMRLLDRNVDAIVPFCLHRMTPYEPVLFYGRGGGFRPVGWGWFKDKRPGLWNITNMAVGNAGMLIQRHVLKEMKDPWFEQGRIDPECGGSDLWFCHKLAEHGFNLYLDGTTVIGHLTHGSVVPLYESGQWMARFETY